MSDSIYADRSAYVGIWDEPESESAFGYCVTVDCHSRLTNGQAKSDGKCYWCAACDGDLGRIEEGPYKGFRL